MNNPRPSCCPNCEGDKCNCPPPERIKKDPVQEIEDYLACGPTRDPEPDEEENMEK
jgi:hypothetical protein